MVVRLAKISAQISPVATIEPLNDVDFLEAHSVPTDGVELLSLFGENDETEPGEIQSETVDIGPQFTINFDIEDKQENKEEEPENEIEEVYENKEELSRESRFSTSWKTMSCPDGCECTINYLRAKKVLCKNIDLTKKKNRPPVDLTVLDLTNSTIDLR